jgi:hypothetical protein
MAPEFGNPIEHLPLIPADVLKKHRVYEPLDTRFRAAARLLQALWREDRGLPIGNHTGEDGKRHKLGSRISEAAGKNGGNYLTPEIAYVARREVAYREIGAMIDQERLATNLLSSMPLTFNLFARLVQKPERADELLYALLPDFGGLARKTLFEHSPGRGDLRFTGDYTAFDAFLKYDRVDGRKGFIAIEVKYSESMREPEAKLRPRYDQLSETSGLFIDHAAAALRSNPLQQLWREHLLAQSMVDAGLYHEGYFITIAPALNYHVQSAVGSYRSHLREADEENKVRFVNLTLEDVIEAIRRRDPSHGGALHRRYCDFWLLDGEMELNAPSFGMRPKRAAEKKPDTSGAAPAEASVGTHAKRLAPRRKRKPATSP